MGILAEPDVDAVQADDQDALRGTDVQDDPPPGPAGGQLELAFVDARWVVCGDVRGEAGKWHLDIRVLRQIGEALHRPATRDGDLAPIGARFPVRGAEELEPPGSVELDAIGVRDGMHREPVEGRELRGEPRPGDPGESGEPGDHRHLADPAVASSSCQAWAGR